MGAAKSIETIIKSPSSDSPHTILLHGYLRHMATDLLQKHIPFDVIRLIRSYYPNFTIYGIGSNKNNHLGADTPSMKKFTKLNQLSQLVTNINGIHLGWNRCVIKDMFNQLYCAGINSNGQTGFQCEIEEIEAFSQMFTTMPISCNALRTNPNLEYFVELIACRSFFVLNDNETESQNVFVCGPNYKGETAMQQNYIQSCWKSIERFSGFKERIVSIKGGYYHTLFLTKDGKVYAAGDDEFGQCAGANIKQQPLKFEPNVFIDAIFCGRDYNFCIDRRSKTVWVFGSNRNGALGLELANDDTWVNVPIRHPYFSGMDIVSFECGLCFSACLEANGNAYFFGHNNCGQLCNGKYEEDIYVPYRFQNDERFKDVVVEQIQCGGFHSVLLTKSNEIICFGSNLSHQCSAWRGKEYITDGYVVSRKEIGIVDNEYIERIITEQRTTLVIVNNHRIRDLNKEHS